MTYEELSKLIPYATPERFKQHAKGGGWVEISANVDASCTIEGIVSGNAQVCGDAWVCGEARVCGDAWDQTPLMVYATKNTVSVSAYGKITIGCQTHTVADWLKHGPRIAKENGWTKENIAEYRMIIKLCAQWMKHHGVDKVTEDKK